MKKKGLAKAAEKEIIRAVMGRMQSVDIDALSPPIMKQNKATFDDVEENLNIPYMNRMETPLAMDVFRKKGTEQEESPVIVLVHGGGFCMGDRKISRPLGRWLAHKGYLVFSVEYSLLPNYNVLDELDDVCAGLDLVGQKLVDYNVDFSRIYMISESAGAYLSTYVTAMHGSENLERAIGHKRSRFNFKAIGLVCGMFYSDVEGAQGEQMFGSKNDDPNFRKYLDPEHPDIINNLPPAYLLTSRGDFVNGSSFRMHEALNKAGRPNHLYYYGGDELVHAFNVLQIDNPKTRELMDGMLEWFEEQTQLSIETEKKKAEEKQNLLELREKLREGSYNGTKIWELMEKCNSFSTDAVKKVALIDCTREYNYEDIFIERDSYARAFSGLNIGQMSESRVAVAGAITAEPLFCFLGLNMTGAEVSMFSYPDFLPSGKWKTMIEKEKITDLIIQDIFVTPSLWKEIQEEKEALGLRNIILLHSKMGGPCIGPAELVYNEFNYRSLRRRDDTVFMEDLISEYENQPISLGEFREDGIALICHTSGTTKGTRKPIIYREGDLTKSVLEYQRIDAELGNIPATTRTREASIFDYSAFNTIWSATMTQLINGGVNVLTFFGFMYPKFINAIDYYELNKLVASGFMIDKWMKRDDIDDVDLSSLKLIMVVGSFISEENRIKYLEFFRKHGFKGKIYSVYAMSEVCASLLASSLEEDDMGQPFYKDCIRICDENDHQYYTLDDGPRTGVLCMSGPAIAVNELDGETLFDYAETDGRCYIYTNDLVRIEEDGRVMFVGRADKYFVNNDGKRFDSGIVETEMTKHSNIKSCAVAPVLEKRIHDTVPVLYVVPSESDEGAAERIRQAFVDVYVNDGKIDAENLPVQLMIVDSLPVNQNGKIDIFRITRERLLGDAYNIMPVRKNGNLTDIKLEQVDSLNSIVAATPEGMGESSAFNLFDLFNEESTDSGSGLSMMLDLLIPDKKPKKKFSIGDAVSAIKADEEMNEIFGELYDKLLVKYMKKMGKKSGMKDYDYDIED
ncbi:MAG: AMP-binding protein [Clostridiales bacterium]|nr:AMP-binding protein [Candidatus Crickella equi]